MEENTLRLLAALLSLVAATVAAGVLIAGPVTALVAGSAHVRVEHRSTAGMAQEAALHPVLIHLPGR